MPDQSLMSFNLRKWSSFYLPIGTEYVALGIDEYDDDCYLIFVVNDE